MKYILKQGVFFKDVQLVYEKRKNTKSIDRYGCLLSQWQRITKLFQINLGTYAMKTVNLMFGLLVLLTSSYSMAAMSCEDFLLNSTEKALTTNDTHILNPLLIEEILNIGMDSTAYISVKEAARILESNMAGAPNEDFSTQSLLMLRNARQVYAEAYLAGLVASIPYENELRRRSNLPIMSPEMIQRVYGVNLVVDPTTQKPVFNSPISGESIDITKMPPAYIASSITLAQQKAKREVLNLATQEQGFIELGLEFNPDLAQDDLTTGASSDFNLADYFVFTSWHDRLNEESVVWIYQTLAREKVIRLLLSQEDVKAGLSWAKNARDFDKYILLMSANPWILLYYNRIDLFGFINRLNFTDTEGIDTYKFRTNLEDLNPELLIKLYISKEMSFNDDTLTESISPELVITKPEVDDFDPDTFNETEFEHISLTIQKRWSEFILQQGIRLEVPLRIALDDFDPTSIAIALANTDPEPEVDSEQLRLILDFFLNLKTGSPLNSKGLNGNLIGPEMGLML